MTSMEPFAPRFRGRLFASACAFALAAGLAGHAWGQAPEPAPAPAAEEAEEASKDRIVVTGSRIKRAGFDTLQPATVIESEFLELRAFENVAEALNELPSFGIPGAANSDDQSGFNVGQNFVNFFGLGSQRTLTLVNGRRFVSSNPPTLFSDAAAGLQVDLNNIPIGLVDRVETIAVGGAPIYGADAIAGTVNIFLKDDFEGIESSLRGGITETGDSEAYQGRLLLGGNFGEGRGNAVVSLEYTKEEGLLQRDRDFTRRGGSFQPSPSCTASGFARCYITDITVHNLTTGGLPSSADFFAFAAPITLDGTPGGQMVQFGPNGDLVPFDLGTRFGSVFSSGGDGLVLGELESIKAPIERRLFNAFGHYDLNENVRAFAELYFANSIAEEQGDQPGAGFNTFIFGPGDSGAIRFTTDNPFLTAQARQVLAANGLTEFWLHRANTDILSGSKEGNEVNVYRSVVGLEGDFDAFGRNFEWDLSFNYGRSRGDSSALAIYDRAFYNAIDAVIDPQTGEIVCRVTLEPPDPPGGGFIDGGDIDPAVDGCQPLNLFGDGAPSQEAIDFVTGRQTAASILDQTVYSANITGDLFNLPAGPVAAAVGVEYRAEKGEFRVDGFSSINFTRVAPIEDISGQFNSSELYGEIVVPIISESQGLFVNSLTFEGAYRYLDNDRAGGADVYTYGLRFRPIADIELRGNKTRSVRSPALVELFLPLSTTFSFANDPCDASNVNQNPVRLANCAAELGALGIDVQNFQSNILNATAIGKSGGNPNLQNEVADAWSAGAIFRPRFAEGLMVAVDYVDIELGNAITQATLTNIMESCYDSAVFPNTSCNFFERNAQGQVIDFQTGFQNAGFQNFAAVTLDAEYQFDVADLPFIPNDQDWGSLSLGLNVFKLTELEVSLTGNPNDIDLEVGEFDDPEWRAQVNANWSRGPLSVFWQTRWIDEVAFNVEATPTAQDIASVDAYWIHNASLGYDLTPNLSARLSVNNVFDTDPPDFSNASNSALALYDIFGRSYTVQLTSRF